MANQTEVLVLQHPGEVRQAKGSARLLQLSLARCALHVGETFDEAALQGWLHASPATPVLLYPDGPATAAPTGTASPTASLRGGTSGGPVRLVILDGTWRKSLKMLHLNAALRSLPRLALRSDTATRYMPIRKARRPGQLSTLEACCLALSQLEQAPERYAPLLDAFDYFVATQAARVPAAEDASLPPSCP